MSRSAGERRLDPPRTARAVRAACATRPPRRCSRSPTRSCPSAAGSPTSSSITTPPRARRSTSPGSSGSAATSGIWGAVDAFGRYIAGPAWQRGLIGDAAVHAWAESEDRWWRRAALVATVPLNLRAAGGTGDTERTLADLRAARRRPRRHGRQGALLGAARTGRLGPGRRPGVPGRATTSRRASAARSPRKLETGRKR